MLAEKNAYIGSAYKHLQVISQDEEKRLEYEAREKAIRDYNQIMLEAKQMGRAEGREEGREEGRAEGREEGRAEGREEGIERVNKLNTLLINDKRYQDLECSVNNAAFQKQLMLEYGI